MATIPKELTGPAIDAWIILNDSCEKFRAELSTLSAKLDPEADKDVLQKLFECSDRLKFAEVSIPGAGNSLIDAAAGVNLTT